VACDTAYAKVRKCLGEAKRLEKVMEKKDIAGYLTRGKGMGWVWGLKLISPHFSLGRMGNQKKLLAVRGNRATSNGPTKKWNSQEQRPSQVITEGNF